MVTRRTTIGALGASVVALLGGCGPPGSGSFRFRMTAEAETPQGTRRASSVFAVTVQKAPKVLPEEGARWVGLKGEAVVLDVDSGPVFLLMRGVQQRAGDFVEMSLRTLDHEYRNWPDSTASAQRLGRALGRSGEVARERWPLMVRFQDPRDPKTVTPVDPLEIGVRRIVLEVTDAPVSTGIAGRLPDFTRSSGFDAWYAQLAMDDPRRVSLNDFRSGF